MVWPEFVLSDVTRVFSFPWVHGLGDFRSEAADLVNVTALKGGASRVVCSSWWVHGLTGFKSKGADLASECHSS